MPLGAFEARLLRLLAANRSPESFVGGATVLHRAPDSPRTSQDVDLFHDEEEAVSTSALRDVETLRAAGYEAEFTTRQPSFWRASVREGSFQSKLEWVRDSAFRFFPVEPDLDLGWRLHWWDAATNKVLALAGREKLRDKLDTLFLHRSHLPFGALVWAAAAKDPGLSPEMILELAARFGRIPSSEEEWRSAGQAVPADPTVIKREFVEMIESARPLIASLPADEMGCFYLDPLTLQPVCPDPDASNFATLIRHRGRLGGAWPQVAE